ncbi:hypothetical protein SD10_15470 [Spirosoma radiotolerans]|uniref:HTH luxR-type domain-containing protein n=1 Tax=Spirosoma radiotolerans TaxID=1379870 RepID=A0A0E3ZVZ5_9BACT|nr:hypothetical protein SD10_15470 [Spirosoma radiotolerans]
MLLNQFDTSVVITKNRAYAFRLLNEVNELANKADDDQLARYSRYLRDTYAKNTSLSNAQKATLFLAVSKRAAEDDDPQIAAICQHFAGQYYFLSEEYGKAFEHLLAANNGFRQIGYPNIPEISRYLYELAFDYYYFGEYDKTIRLLNESAHYPPFNSNLAIQTYNTLGLAHNLLHYNKTGSDGSPLAERNFRKARQLAISYGDSLWVGIVSVNLAGENAFLKKWSAALPLYRQSYRLIRRFGQRRELPSEAALQIGFVFFQLGNLDSCRYYLERTAQFRQQQRTRQFATNLQDEYGTVRYYDLSRLYYKAVGNLPLAYRYLDSLAVLKERINKRYNSERLSLVNQRLMIQQHQSEVAAIDVEKNAQQTLFWLVSAGLTLLVGLILWLYHLSQLRRRQERVIEAEKEKSMRLEKQLVEEELSQAKADLARFVDNLSQKEALIDTITAQLADRAPNTYSIAETRQNLVNSSLLTNDDWDEFRRRFERVYPGFFWQLKTQFSDLSPAEERLLALSKLKIDSRQMSQMLGISPESIRKTRYRLRKKLGLEGDSPLLNLLNEPQDTPKTPD